MFNFFYPPPAPPGFAQGKLLPESDASLISKLLFNWLAPFLEVGFSRPLEKEDLWELPTPRLAATLTSQVEHNFYARCPPDQRPRHTSSPPTQVDEHNKDKKSGKSKSWGIRLDRQAKEKVFKKYDSSLVKALHRTFIFRWWTAGILKLIADTLKTTTPLVTKVLLTWLTEAYIWHRLSPAEQAESGLTKPRGIGYGIGLAFALFAMQEVASLMTNHYTMITMTTGVSIRSGVIGSIFRKSLRLSARARVEHSVGQIATMISTDASRLDQFSVFAHNVWVGPIQIVIGIVLLIVNLGYSALVGLGVLILSFPVQIVLFTIMFSQRRKGVKITDQRVRLTTEVLQGIRLLKFYAWETFYTGQISNLREGEIRTIKKAAIARSALIATMLFSPILASILSFITYALSGHDLNIAIIFSSLQYFNIIRAPLVFFPLVLAGLADVLVAAARISKFLTAEELAEPFMIDDRDENKIAVDVDGDFTWETVGKRIEKFEIPDDVGGGPGRGGGRERKQKKAKPKSDKKAKVDKKAFWQRKSGKEEVLPTTADPDMEDEKGEGKGKEEEKPFELKNLKMQISKGSFVAIVGRVGSGKSSLLQAIIGEMRRTKGNVTFGGTVAYVPQSAWIRNATLRENVLFGQPDDEERFRSVVRACSLEHDLEILPQGELTEIGEKGINLSGGQKARVSLARAAYSPSDVVLMDDCLSAVDAYVGKSILENCILSGPLAERTRILVTHALHVLDKTDYIYVMEDGVITEEGTYSDLMKDSVVFARLMDEYGNLKQEKEKSGSKGSEGAEAGAEKDSVDLKKEGGELMSAEERATGAVSWDIYTKYLKYAGGLFWAPTILLLLTLAQGAQVGSNLFLGFWTSNSIRGFRQGDYMAVYGSLGIASAAFSFLTSLAFAFASLSASLSLFKAALRAVLRSPSVFFDTTPAGRILSRLSKDQDTLDNELSMTLYQFLNTFSSVIGTIALVFYTFPYLGILFIPLSFLYWFASVYYRRTSVETKRLDSLMRSVLYGSFAETLTGLSTVRAYRNQEQFIRNADEGLDLENRAYYMTVAIQQWLIVRLDFFGNVLVLGIGLFAAGFRATVDPSKIGVVLSYTLSITQIFSQMVSQFAQNEQHMNAVERVLVYTELPPEGLLDTPNDPPASWPEKGVIKFEGVEMAYRKGLPLVLKGVTFDIKPSEKVGIVGRTGAGKSSLMQALFRVIELQSGKIEIDGRNIREMGLDVLRQRLAVVPQDSVLFLGTLRDNLDPQGTRTDAELISALQRTWLLPNDGSHDAAAEAKFSLDSTISDEGSNFSAGEKQLLALCRALVKNSQIIVLDEATSNVDVETDSKLQKTIQTEFASNTLLCIAHRLNTVAYYDRVIVMDAGKIAEFDTVLNLFDRESSIFRSLCNEAGLSRQDILRIRQESVVTEV